ncbi:hypothetical protein [Lentzea sp. NPDC060358]|uniref:hypothetical protein n=1 Tax=Lentzea sp. NPDC060358 TaxID=3347103 RepID=UPI00364D61A7
MSLGLLVAVMLPVTLSRRGSRLWLCVAMSLSYGAYVVFPVLDGVAAVVSWLSAGAATVVLVALGRRAGEQPVSVKPRAPVRVVLQRIRAQWWPLTVLVVLVATLLVVLISSRGTHAIDLLSGAIRDHRWSVVLSGLIAAVFLSDDLIRVVLRPTMAALTVERVDVAALQPTSLHIGWLERALVFVLIAGGQADAAALGITIKALFRLGDGSQDRHVLTEYYLIGTLTSVVLATVVAVVVRIGLGLSPL